MKRIHLALAGGAVAVASLVPLTSSAHAVVCDQYLQPVCATYGAACRALDDSTLGVRCAQLG